MTTATTSKNTAPTTAIGQSVASLCSPRFTTNLSYRFPVLKLPPPPCAVLVIDNFEWFWGPPALCILRTNNLRHWGSQLFRLNNPVATTATASGAGTACGAAARLVVGQAKRSSWWTRLYRSTIWRFSKTGVPINGWFIRGKSHSNGWLGGTPILGNPHLGTENGRDAFCCTLFATV